MIRDLASRPAVLLDFWRDARWLNAERARAYGAMLALALAGMAAWLLWSSFIGLGPGGDFLSFYAASRQALAGQPAAAWSPDLHMAVEAATIPGFSGDLAFFYPPPYLLVCWPLGLLPFGAALLVWIGATGSVALNALVALLGRAGLTRRDGALLLLAFPGFWINMSAGQNGALTLAILAGGFAFLDRRPILSGALFGMMIVKPQLAIALPFVLAATGRWKAFVATGFAVAAYTLISLLCTGAQGFGAFFANLENAASAASGGVDPALLQTWLAMLLPLSSSLAIVVQAIVSLAVIMAAVVVARRGKVDAASLGALTTAATLAASPFVLDYDLLVAALPLGWLVARGTANGFRPWEKLSLATVGLVPLVAREVAMHFGVHLGPLGSLWLFLAVATRVLAERSLVRTSAAAVRA